MGINSHGYYGTKTYKSWDCMIQRCTNPNHGSYSRYGNKGISICDEWRDFKNFLSDMGERPEGMTLDRIDNSKGYHPDNCRWANSKTQARNQKRRKTTFKQAEEVRILYLKGNTPKEIREETGLSKGVVDGIIYLGNLREPE